jgi:protoporphyrinogen oxidase
MKKNRGGNLPRGIRIFSLIFDYSLSCEPRHSKCLESFLASRESEVADPVNYEEWLHQAFGPVFAGTFPRAYTKKHWTVAPS